MVDTLIDQTQVTDGVDSQVGYLLYYELNLLTSSSKENRDHHIGRLFGAEAIIKSGVLFRPDDSNGVFDRILDVVYELAKRKPWLREQCGFVLYRSLDTLTKLDQNYAQSVVEKLQSAGLAKTPEGVAIWIAISKNLPSVNLPCGVWRGNSPLSQEEKSRLALVLKEASVPDLDIANSDANVSLRGSWSTNVHFAWLVVMDELMSPSDSKMTTEFSKRLSFSEFWTECVDSKISEYLIGKDG